MVGQLIRYIETRVVLCFKQVLKGRPLSMFAQQVEERGGGRRELRAATMDGPEGSIVRKPAYGDADEYSSRELFAYAHSWHETQAHALLYESLYRLDGRQLERDIQRRVMLREGFNNFSARRGVHVVSDEWLAG